MKQSKYILAVITILAMTFMGCNVLKKGSYENDELTYEKLQQIVEEQNFIFKARQAIPMQGKNISLTSDYDVKLSNDTLEVYLPYFGRAYTAPFNTNEGGIKFKATQFEYTVNPKKNKSLDVIIKPINVNNPDVRGIALYFNFYENGSASLDINMTNRQSISFFGTVYPNKKP